jgi:Domain of unknown function (DUF1707)
MTQPDPGAIRIGTEERDAAMRALDTHLSAGRIDAEEYGERSAKVYTARTWGEITPLFSDLPEPRPAPTPPRPRSPATMVPADLSTPVRRDRALTSREHQHGRVGAAVISLSPLIAVALFFLTDSWVWFLLIPVAAIIVGAINRAERG